MSPNNSYFQRIRIAIALAPDSEYQKWLSLLILAVIVNWTASVIYLSSARIWNMTTLQIEQLPAHIAMNIGLDVILSLGIATLIAMARKRGAMYNKILMFFFALR
jgi:hypothetical protein